MLGRPVVVLCLLMGTCLVVRPLQGQLLTAGAGILLTESAPQPVFELHAATPPLRSTRAYATVSWTDDTFAPAIITAAERRLVKLGSGTVTAGAGALILTGASWDAIPILVSSTVVPWRVPRTSLVAIASTQPFHAFQWSLVLKASYALWFVR